jgi:signal transduction histidine kinase/ligand-binding sensor domain-containing protein
MRKIALGCLLLAWCPAVSALDPTLDLNQYSHTVWRAREGFTRGYIVSMAQTPDGYLWLGTEFGLVRFDGVRSVPWEPPAGATFPNPHIRALLAGRDGTLWIGTLGGLVSLRAGKLTRFPQFDGLFINALTEDRDATVWFTAVEAPRGVRLCSIRKAIASCEADSEALGDWAASLYVDSRDRLWVTSSKGLWQLAPGTRKLHPVPEGGMGSLQSLAEGSHGSMLFVARHEVMRLSQEEVSAVPPGAALPAQPNKVLRDRHGGIWVGTVDRGLMHIYQGRVNSYTRADGLSGDSVQRIFEDREGNVWVATLDGLDRFSDVAASTYSVEQGLPNALVTSVLATRDGSIWMSTRSALKRWLNGEGTLYVGKRRAGSAVSQVVVSGLPDRPATLFEDRLRRLWHGSDAGLGYLQYGRFTLIDGVPAGSLIDAIVEDRDGALWVAHRTAGLIRVSRDTRVETFAWSQLGREDAGMRIAVDPVHDGLWIGFMMGGIAHFREGRVDKSLSVADGLGKGRVYWLQTDLDGTLWVATEGGLSRVKDGRVVTLTSHDGLPCDPVDWMLQDEDIDDVWVYTACGIAQIKRSDLHAAFTARERGVAEPVLRATVFDTSDGVRSTMTVGSYTPHVGRSPDGRLWFASLGGVGVLNPQRIPHNPIPPPVHIEQVLADRRNYDASLTSGSVALPPLTRDLQIDYTALSLTAPEKMRFRHRLEGHDQVWRDVGTRRQGFYTDLSPGNYRFRVIASNNDGVWNEIGATLNLSIEPTFYQTRLFTALCIAIGAAMLWLLLWWRGRQIEMRMRLRLEERVLERERIARDLHDTFLQSMQGLVLRFHAVMAKLPEDGVARRMMEQALNRADDVITEGRASVYDLRQSAHVTDDLPQALTAIGEERADTTDTKFLVTIQGMPRHLHPVVREEAYRIGAEALANAFTHAAARNIEVRIEYGRKGLVVRVVDDGRGYDVAMLEDAVAHGHFGLAGLRERAHRIRAQLEVSSRPGAGSAVELRVPASTAYATGRGKSSAA